MLYIGGNPESKGKFRAVAGIKGVTDPSVPGVLTFGENFCVRRLNTAAQIQVVDDKICVGIG